MDNKKKKVEFIPLMKDCTYHYPERNGGCPNCNNTGKYKDGYYMIINGKTGFFVDTIK